MSKLALIMRHGKSSWKEIGADDHARRLTKRGKRDAVRIGETLRERDTVPDLIISSTAKRARSTATRVAEACRYDGDILYDPKLYFAGLEPCIAALAQAPAQAEIVMLVGHNPTSEELINHLTPEQVMMPTATVACIELPIAHWAELRDMEVEGRLRWVLMPRELAAEI